MVLAAGFGTRLRPLTDLLPKPVVPFGDRTPLAEVIERARAAGAPRIVVNAHHYAARVREGARAAGADVLVSEEAELLGTAGGLGHAAGLLGAGDVLVWNVDCLTEADLTAFVAAHAGAQAAAGAAATLLVRVRPRGQGALGLDAASRIVRMRTTRVADETRGADFLGLHVVGAELRSRLPRSGCIVADLYIPALAAGALLQAVPYDGPFLDLGTPRSYLDANLAWLAHRATGMGWVGPRATVAPGITLEQALVGAGATVRGDGTLERCVVWPGATAVAPLKDAIVAGQEVVRVV